MTGQLTVRGFQGMKIDEDARRINPNEFALLANTYSDRVGNLVKAPNFSEPALSLTGSLGDVRDIHRVYDFSGTFIGYLIAGDLLFQSSSLTDGTPDYSFEKCRSSLIRDEKGIYYYVSTDADGISNPKLRQWKPKGAGVQGEDHIVDFSFPEPLPAYEDLFLQASMYEGAPIVVYYQPTAYGGGGSGYLGSQNPQYAYDSDELTYARIGYVNGAIFYYGYPNQVVNGSWTTRLVFEVESVYGGWLKIWKSTNGGTDFTELLAWYGEGHTPMPGGKFTLKDVIESGTNLNTLAYKFEVVRYQTYRADAVTFRVYDIRTTEDDPVVGTLIANFPDFDNRNGYCYTVKDLVSDQVISMVIPDISKIPLYGGSLMNITGFIFAVNNTYGWPNPVAVTVDYTFSNLPGLSGQTIYNLAVGHHLIEIPLGGVCPFTDPGSLTLTLTIPGFPGGSGVTNVFAFRWAMPFYILDSDGNIVSNTNFNGTPSTTSEMLMGLLTDNTPLDDGPYNVNMTMVNETDNTESAAGYPLENKVEVFGVAPDYGVILTSIDDLNTYYQTYVLNNPDLTMTHFRIYRSFVGGGELYKAFDLPVGVLDSWPNGYPSDKFTGYNYVATPYLVDILTALQQSTTFLDEEIKNYPTEYDFLQDSICSFRNRLWGLIRSEDSQGNPQTYIHYSEVNEYQYWPALNEIWIPGVVEIRPLRDDVMYAFTRRETYRISPSGANFEFVKVADVGVGHFQLEQKYGTTHATRLAANISDVVVFVNDLGIHLATISGVEHLQAESSGNLSLIQLAIRNDAILSPDATEERLYLSSKYAYNLISGDYLCLWMTIYNRSISVLSWNRKIRGFREILDEDTIGEGNRFFLLDNGVVLEDASETQGSQTSIIKSKRFITSDLGLVRLYYFAMSFLAKATGGNFDLTFRFNPTGSQGGMTEVTKTISEVDATNPNVINTKEIQAYGTGYGVEVEIRHTGAGRFTLRDFTLGYDGETSRFVEG